MDFEWDEAKSERNRIGRGLSFDVAITLFDGPVLLEVDSRRDYGERRMKALGMVAGEIYVCIFTDRGLVRRIISLRHANRRERDAYRAAKFG